MSTKDSLQTISRGGAPAGNKNALKHGFYSRKFKPREGADLQARTSAGLNDEINLMRITIRRFCDQIGEQELDTPTHFEYVRILSLAIGALDRLIRTQNLVCGTAEEVVSFPAKEFNLALEILRARKRGEED